MKIFHWLIALGLFFALVITVWEGKQYLDCTEIAKQDLDSLHIRSVTASEPDPNFCSQEEALFDKWQTCLQSTKLAQKEYFKPVLNLLNDYTNNSLHTRWQKHLEVCPQ